MKLLITGGLGFIGSHYINYILENTEDLVLNVDIFTYASILRKETSNRYQWMRKDIVDLTESDLEGIDCIVNFAAETHVDQSIPNPNIFYRSNVFGALNLFQLALKKQIRILQVSTDEVFGSLPKGVFATEYYPFRPGNFYSASKAAAELAGMASFNTYKLDIVVTRSVNNYGPKQHKEKFIPTILNNLKSGKEIPVYGKGEHRRDWLYVQDNCRAIDLVLRKGKAGESYNIAGGNEMANIEILTNIEQLTNIKAKIKYIPDEVARPGHDMRYGLNDSKIKELGWQPSMGIESGLLEAIKYDEHRNN